MAENGKANGHKLEGLGRMLNPLARQLSRPRADSVAFDLEAGITQVLSLGPEPHPYRRIVRVLRGTSYLDKFNGKTILDY